MSSIRSEKRTIYFYLTSISGAAIAPAMFFLGLKLTTAIDSSLLSNGEIIFSILLALTAFGEKLNRIGYIAMALVLIGVIIVTTNLQFDSSLLKINTGNLFIIGATLFWGLDNNISRMLSHRIDITKIIQLKVGTVNSPLILSLSSVFVLVLAAIFLHERITIFQIIAVGIMLSGIYLINRNNQSNAGRLDIKTKI